MPYGQLMTRPAIAFNLAVVHRRLIPGKRSMTVITRVRAGDMRGVFTRGQAAVVTTATDFRGAFENTVNVAGLAINFYVLATEWEACGEMIEVGVLHGIGSKRQ